MHLIFISLIVVDKGFICTAFIHFSIALFLPLASVEDGDLRLPVLLALASRASGMSSLWLKRPLQRSKDRRHACAVSVTGTERHHKLIDE